MKSKMLSFVMILGLILLVGLFFHLQSAARAGGNTYYVDDDCDGSGNGSLGDPWCTIQEAANVVGLGDTVLINPGTYAGGVQVDVSGTAVNPITFKGNGANVIINGSGSGQDGINVENADYIIIDGITVQLASRAGVRIVLADHVTVRNSTFIDNGKWGVFTGFADYTTVENIESYGAIDEHGIYISNSSDYPVIRGNRLHHNHANGLHMNGDASLSDPGHDSDGVISFGLIENNIIYENGVGGGSGINMDGVTDTIVRNNLLYDNHASGISIYQIDGGSGSQNNLILNNTILMPANGRWAINIPDITDINNKIFNNILLSDHAFRGSITIPSASLTGFESDYNIVVNRLSADDGNSNMSLAAWQGLGFDAHSFIATANNLFVNPAAHDYRLKAGSPAIDAGRTLADVPTDLEGKPRPIGAAFDIGAYEYGTPPQLFLTGTPGDQSIQLNWDVTATLPPTSTWRITYAGSVGNPPSPIINIPNATRSYQITQLTNYTMHTVTLNAMVNASPVLTDTITIMPTDLFNYLPVVLK